MSPKFQKSHLTVELENIGGIERARSELPPGITALTGRNATNRTSFLQGIMAAMGSTADQITLKSDADEAKATIELGEETYTRTLTRTGETIVMGGKPYTEKAELLDLYAFLLKENPVRQTIEQDGDLHSVLMRPIDMDEIEAEIQHLRSKKQDLEAELEQITQYKQQLPLLEEQRTKLENELEALRTKETELLEKKEALEEQFNDTTDEKSEQVTNLEEQLTEQRTEKNQVERKLEQQRKLRDAAINDLESADKPDVDKSELRAERDRLKVERDHLSEQIDTLRTQQEEITAGMEAARTLQDSTVSIEQAISQLDVDIEIPDGPLTTDKPTESENLTEALVEGEQIRCLACGNQVTTDTVDAVINQYREINTTFREQIRTLESEQQDVQHQLKEVKSQLARWEQAEDRLTEAKSQKQRAEEKINAYEEQLEETTEAIQELKSELETAREEAATGPDKELQSEHAVVEDELIDTEVDIRQTEAELDDIESRIEEFETELQAEEKLHNRRDDVIEEIEALQSHVEDTERELVEEFNQTIETVLNLLGYKNIERIWIERKRKDVKVGRRTEEQTVFELNIVREGTDGVYADELRHLSESERSVTGLVVALTGYIVHDVAEICPLMVLDSVEMIDSERIAQLVEYFADETEYLVTALLPEDSAEVTDALPQANPIEINSQVN